MHSLDTGQQHLLYGFRARPHPSERDQGGSIDLHPQGGQLALQEAGLFDEFKRLSHPEAEALKLLRPDGNVIHDENLPGNQPRPEQYSNRPEIERAKLRDLLLESLRPDTVDGTTEKDYDLVVGADGAWSRVRPILTDQQPIYSGITAIELWANDVNQRHRWLGDFVGAGSLFMFDEGRAIQAQRNGDNSIRILVSVRQPENWLETCGIDCSSPRPEDAIRKYLDEYFNGCAHDLIRACLDANDQMVPRKLYMLPIGMRWESDVSPRVTLLGDAAHLMTPFGGVGMNLAMIDSLNLAKAIAASCDGTNAAGGLGLEKAIKDYEQDMLDHAEQFANRTWKGLENHFSAGGGDAFVHRVLTGRK
ncbi:hypothetical protein LTS15_004678 [Exophiala xenobiotica]|nr:hypothetical protein LTS15_004678 [Exophiala xenobiotica]